MSFFGHHNDDDIDGGYDDGSVDTGSSNDGGDDILGYLSSKYASNAVESQTLDADSPLATDTSTDIDDDIFGFTSSAIATSPSITPVDQATSTPFSDAAATSPTAQSAAATSPPATSSGTVTSIPSATLASAAATSSTTGSTTTGKSGVSRLAVGVTVVIFFLAFIAAIFFCIRRRYIHKRENRRLTWNVPIVSPKIGAARDLEPGKESHEFDQVDIIHEKPGPLIIPDPVSYSNYSPAVEMPPTILPAPPPLHPTGYAPPRMPSPPPVIVAMYEDQPGPLGVDSPAMGSAPATALVASTPFSAAKAPQIGTGNDVVVVARTFIPTLPDELSIQTGEHIRVLSRFDDGWCHVERLRSGFGAENGMVPQECLESLPALPAIPEAGLTQEAVEQWRLNKRKSSLAPAGPVHY